MDFQSQIFFIQKLPSQQKMKYQLFSSYKSMMKILIALLLLLQPITSAPAAQTSQYRIAQVLDYNNTFSERSDVSVVVLACGGKKKLQLTMKSFFYFNTYRLNRLYIVHCSLDTIPISVMLPFGFETNRGNVQIIGATGEEFGLVDALDNVYERIKTKYVFQMDGQWVMVKGFGFIEQAINILKYGARKSIKMSQVVSNYPYWRATARLTQMKWTDSGQAFHQIMPFTPQSYSSFTLSPSLFQIQTLYTRILGRSLKKACELSRCAAQSVASKYEFDKCCVWAVGQQIHRAGFLQVYFNDGTGLPHHEYLQQ